MSKSVGLFIDFFEHEMWEVTEFRLAPIRFKRRAFGRAFAPFEG